MTHTWYLTSIYLWNYNRWAEYRSKVISKPLKYGDIYCAKLSHLSRVCEFLSRS